MLDIDWLLFGQTDHEHTQLSYFSISYLLCVTQVLHQKNAIIYENIAT